MSTYARSTCDTEAKLKIGCHAFVHQLAVKYCQNSGCRQWLLGTHDWNASALSWTSKKRENESSFTRVCNAVSQNAFLLYHLPLHPVTSLDVVNESICARQYCNDNALSHPSKALWRRKGQSVSERKVELKGTHWKRTQGPPRSERTLH